MHLTNIRCDSRGKLHLTFDDVAAVRADTVFIDSNAKTISGLIDGWLIKLGEIPEHVMGELKNKSHVALSALHPQGHALELNAALQTI